MVSDYYERVKASVLDPEQPPEEEPTPVAPIGSEPAPVESTAPGNAYYERIKQSVLNPTPPAAATPSPPIQEDLPYYERIKQQAIAGQLVNNPDQDTESTGVAILNELIKSYGFRYDEGTGDWDWDLDTIKKAYKDDPFWTAVDHASLLFPVLKWGRAAKALSAGAEYVGRGQHVARAYAAAKAAGEAPSGFRAARHFIEAGGADIAPWMRLRPGAQFTKKDIELMGRFGAHEDDVTQLAKAASKEQGAAREMYKRWRDDIVLDVRTAEDLPDEARKTLLQAIERGEDISKLPEYAALSTRRSKRGLETFQTWLSKNHEDAYSVGLLDEGAYLKHKGADGRITYVPHIYEEFYPGAEGAVGTAGGRGAGSFLRRTREGAIGETGFATAETLPPEIAQQVADYKAGTKTLDELSGSAKSALRLETRQKALDEIRAYNAGQIGESGLSPLARKTLREHKGEAEKQLQTLLEKEGLTAVTDIAALSDQNFRIGERIAKRKMLLEMAKTPLVQTAEQVRKGGQDVLRDGWVNFGDLLLGTDKRRKMLTEIEEYRAALKGGEETGDLLKKMSKEAQEVLLQHGDEAESHLDTLIKNKSKYELGKIANQVQKGSPFMAGLVDETGQLRNLDDLYVNPKAMPPEIIAKEEGQLQRVHQKILEVFKKSKTSQNIASQVRNMMSNPIFMSLATGNPSFVTEARHYGPGVRALIERNADFREALEYGIIGDNTLKREVTNALKEVYSPEGVRDAGMDLTKYLERLTGEKVAKMVAKSDALASQLYGATDEAAKIGTFVHLRDKFIKKGMSADDAAERAAVDVLRYMPNYSTMNPTMDMIRRQVPFASFPVESARIWKNTLETKPWLVQYYNHIFETLSYLGGAAAGFSPEDIDAGRENLRDFTNQKKMWALPFTDAQGAPIFLDMSYIGPMFDTGTKAKESGIKIGDYTVPVPIPFNPIASNPYFNIIGSWAGGRDLFSGQELRPQLLEDLPGGQTPGGMRDIYAGIEHTARTMLPPLTPGVGYAGRNLGELVTGERNPRTGKELEPSTVATILSNIFGLKTYTPDISGKASDAIREKSEQDKEISILWDRWEKAVANGDEEKAAEMQGRIIEKKDAQLSDRERSKGRSGRKYFEDNQEKHAPGKYQSLSTTQAKKLLEESSRFSDEDRAPLEELVRSREQRRSFGPPMPKLPRVQIRPGRAYADEAPSLPAQ